MWMRPFFCIFEVIHWVTKLFLSCSINTKSAIYFSSVAISVCVCLSFSLIVSKSINVFNIITSMKKENIKRVYSSISDLVNELNICLFRYDNQHVFLLCLVFSHNKHFHDFFSFNIFLYIFFLILKVSFMF